jgi:hypothetical protein
VNEKGYSEFDSRPELRKKRAMAMIVQRLMIALVVMYCFTTLTLLLVLGYQSQEQRNNLLDCTTPEGQCYQDGQRRTKEAIEALINDNQLTRDTVVVAVACAQDRTNVSEEDILHCIQEKK